MPSKSSTKSVIRENERGMGFIDGSNLYHVLTLSCGRHDLQFDKFALKLANGRDLKRIYYYNIRQESDTNPNMGVEQQKFLDSMYDTPYVEVRLGIWKQRGDIMVEKGVDVMLATDLVTHAYKDHYDTAIVVSGDADFYPALQAVKDVGKHIEVAAFDMNLSGESGRVADVVRQASGLNDYPQIGGLTPVRHLAAQHFANSHTERAPDTANFQAMGQAGVNVIVAGYRVNLGFLAQAAEGAGKNDAVVILVKGRAPQFVVAGDRFAQSFAAQQCFPIHAWLLWLGRVCGRCQRLSRAGRAVTKSASLD